MHKISNNSVDLINQKLAQLKSVLDLLMVASSCDKRPDFMDETLTDSAWLMLELIRDIKTTFKGETQPINGGKSND